MSGGRRWGVEPICEQLQVAPSTYYDQKSRPPSQRQVRDEELGPVLKDLWKKNYSVYAHLLSVAVYAACAVGHATVRRVSIRTE